MTPTAPPTATLDEMRKETWAMEAQALQAFMRRLEQLEQIRAAGGQPDQAATSSSPVGAPEMRIVDGVAVIPISGYLVKTVPRWWRKYEIEATGYDEIQANLAAAVADEAVSSILLEVDSPGGMVAGSKETADRIFAARGRKPISAHVEDLGASGAYRLASQAERISAGADAEVGSIGVYRIYVDSSKLFSDLGLDVKLIRSGEHKGMGVQGVPITAEQIAVEQEGVNAKAANFIAEVARGREMKVPEVRSLATGRMWIAAEAAKLGLIDEVVSGDATNSAPSGGRSASESVTAGDTEMAEQKEQPAPDVEKIRAQAQKDAAVAERGRLADLEAAFADDPGFAVEQFKAGATVEAAKVAYNDVLVRKLAESQAKNTKLGEQIEKANAAGKTAGKPNLEGAEPVVNEGEGSSAGADFMDVARELAKQEKISMTEAMRRTAREDPELHKAFVDSQSPIRK